MRVVILGGTGFIGSSLAKSLKERGDTVVIPSRTSGKTRPDWANGGRGELVFETWNGRDTEQLARVIDGADGVVNLLGENIAGQRWTLEYKQRIVESRLLAGTALTGAFSLVKTRPSVVIQASAVGWYGSWPDMETSPECTEESSPGVSFLAETAVHWEGSTADIPRNYQDVRRCVIRTSPVLGKNGGMLQSVLPLFRYGLGGPVGSGRQPFAWIHLDDEVAAIVFLLDRADLDGAFNLAAPNPVRNQTFARALGRCLHRPTWLPAPGFLLRLAFGEMAQELLLTGQRVRPQRLVQAGFRFLYPDLESALKQIFLDA